MEAGAPSLLLLFVAQLASRADNRMAANADAQEPGQALDETIHREMAQGCHQGYGTQGEKDKRIFAPAQGFK
tara:strand:- start:574 stop:789 length:216 start_codon:yes stop_codon:yes gene_type:complete